MTARTTTLILAAAFAVLTAAPLASAPAFAQDAITLETIGAVRMISPEELQRRDAEAARQQQQAQPAPRQHAELAQ
jgi:hypothetical protein